MLLDLIDYGCSDRNISLATLIPYRQLLWAVDAHERMSISMFKESLTQCLLVETTLALVKSTKRWLEQIWSAVPIVEVSMLHTNSSICLIVQIGGPSAFCHPAELCTTVLAW